MFWNKQSTISQVRRSKRRMIRFFLIYRENMLCHDIKTFLTVEKIHKHFLMSNPRNNPSFEITFATHLDGVQSEAMSV